MSIVVYHHPFSRAANVVWMLEEVGVDYTLKFVDLMKGEQKSEAIRALNPMGKVPILVDGEAVVTELAAIGMFLADKYAAGRLAPALDDPARGTYLRWCVFAPSVIEPGAMAKTAGWVTKPGMAGWGTYEEMLDAMESAVKGRSYVLGETFSMADVIFGGTLAYMLKFKMVEPRPVFTEYAARLNARPAAKAAEARNAAVAAERGLAG